MLFACRDTAATRSSPAFASSDVASRYQTLAGAEGVGFSFTTADHLTLPAASPTTPRYATVPGRR